jgi:hypothetical protein
MKALTPEELQTALKAKEGIEGVFVYYTVAVIEVDRMTQLVDKDGKVTGGECKPVDVQKIVTVTDYEHPYRIWYEHGILETNQFGVQLSNSVLTGINSQSTADQGKTLANLADAALSFAKVAGAAVAPPPSPTAPNCNGVPTFIRFEKLPRLP